jgi:acyl carrier protein
MQEAISLEKLESVVRPHLKFLSAGDTLEPTQDLGEAGLDSMASIDLLLDLEDSFGISISDDHLTENSFLNLVEIMKLIESSVD